MLHESAAWRTAIHSYEKEVNGIEALHEWGIHEDSEEAFTLLCGEALLIVCLENGKVQMISMEPLDQYVVGVAQLHAIVLKEGARVLIMENKDMSRFQTRPMEQEILREVRKVLN